MQLDKVQQTLRKIQALADNMEADGQTSQLERDLMKRYLRDLYEMVSMPVVASEVVKPAPQVAEVKQPAAPEPVVENRPVEEPAEDPVPEARAEPETPVETIEEPSARKFSNPTKYFPPADQTPATAREQEPAAQSMSSEEENEVAVATEDDRFVSLFAARNSNDVVGQLQSTPLSRIEDGLGLNERLLTINSLFAGDTSAFNETVEKLNECTTFEDARNLLIAGAAAKYGWDDEGRVQKAGEFVHLVRRKFK